MTDLVESKSREVSTSRRPISKAEKVAASLHSVRERLLTPFLEWEAMAAPFRVSRTFSSGEVTYPGFLDLDDNFLQQPTSEEHRQAMLARCDVILAKQPSDADVDRLDELAQEAMAQPFDRATARLCVALMIDAFPNARPHSPETYQETLVSEVAAGSYPPATVAKACNDAVRSAVFLPSIAEVIERLDSAKGQLANIRRIVQHYREKRKRFRENRDWLAQAPIYDQGKRNWDRPPYRTEASS